MLNITVCYATTQKQFEIVLNVEASCTIAMAIKRSGILQRCPDIPFPHIQVGIYSKKAALDDLVKAGDRVEIYRQLTIDPKQARLLRAKKQNLNAT